MVKEKIPHAVNIAQKKDIPVGSRLGYLAFRYMYAGSESSPKQVADVFSAAEKVVHKAMGDQGVDHVQGSITHEFYRRAKAEIQLLRSNAMREGMLHAADELNQYYGVD